MTDYELQHLALLNRIALALEAIALTNAPAPNFVKPIEDYGDFDFTSIGALVKARDANGPTELEWGGYQWTRRSPQNKFGEAIWFSRATGKDAEGNVKYSRLITFKKLAEAEPLPRKVEALLEPKVPLLASAQPEISELEQHFDPDFCPLHHLKMTEVSPKSGLPFHRVTDESGRVGFCTGVEVKYAVNGHAPAGK